MKQPFTRRNFLRRAGCAGMSSLPVLNTMLNLKLAGSMAAAAPANDEYRALVCMFFSGGIDSFNVLVPRGTTEYGEYKATRGALALEQNSLLPINPLGSPGISLGLHPALGGLQSLFEAGRAAFVTNVGTLVEPVTKDNWNNDTGNFPLGLFSHSDQIEQWQTGIPNQRSSRGWAGRAGDLLHSLNGNQLVSMNISLTGGNIWQSGQDVYAYTVGTNGAASLSGYTNGDANSILTRAVDRQLALTYQHLLTEEFANKKRQAMDTYQLFNEKTEAVALPANVNFNENNNYISHQLQMVAKAIAAHDGLGHKRQTFFVEIGGWDHHSDLLSGQAAALPDVNEAVLAFYQCMEALGLHNNVTVFSASDFARTLSSNGNGSDHAWAGNHWVVGGAVQGRKLYGTYPSLVADNPLDVGRGVLIPAISVDSYFAELALWLGVPKSSLNLVLPNIETFYSLSSSSTPLGFLA